MRRPGLSYSNVVATLALFVALGGSAVAARGLISGSKLKNRSVSATKLVKHTITGTEVNMSKLGTVPSAAAATNALHAASADTATHASSADTASHAASADSSTNSTHATSADSATRASSADEATHAANADSLGGMGLTQFSRADSYTGNDTAAFNAGLNETVGTLTSPSIAPGSYLFLARVNTQCQGAGTQFVKCSLQSPSGNNGSSFSDPLAMNNSAHEALMFTDTLTTAGSATISCNTNGNQAMVFSGTLILARLGAQTANFNSLAPS